MIKDSNPYLKSSLSYFGYLPYNLESHLSFCMIAEIHLSLDCLTFYLETAKSQPKSLSVCLGSKNTLLRASHIACSCLEVA